MTAGHWSDRFTRPQLAAALDALGDRAPVLTLAAIALRNGEPSDELADALDDHAHEVAMRWGNYDAHAVCSDAASALRPTGDRDEPEPEPAPRYRAIDCGPFEPPELIPERAADPDEDMGNET